MIDIIKRVNFLVIFNQHSFLVGMNFSNILKVAVNLFKIFYCKDQNCMIVCCTSKIFGDTLGVTVINIGNEISDLSLNLG